MFASSEAFSSFAVRDIQQAKEFYEQTLGLRTSELRLGLLRLHVAGDRGVLLYPKPNHVPASFTVRQRPVRPPGQVRCVDRQGG
jgi:catechol 2,3-dioxygenase-like lactoylglutathione lyase family enzyme